MNVVAAACHDTWMVPDVSDIHLVIAGFIVKYCYRGLDGSTYGTDDMLPLRCC